MSREALRVDRCRRCEHREASHYSELSRSGFMDDWCRECQADDGWPGHCAGFKATLIDVPESPEMVAWDAAFAQVGR